jgi:prevent-host-death family protein
MRHPRQDEIVAKAAAAGQQPKILLAPDRLTYAGALYHRPHHASSSRRSRLWRLVRNVFRRYMVTTRLLWTSNMDIKHVPAANFKAECLRLLDEVASTRRPIIVTKRGKPVAKLVPVEAEPLDLFGYMAGTAKICGDIISPIDDAGWTGDEDNI